MQCSFSTWPLFKKAGPGFQPTGVCDAPGAAERSSCPVVTWFDWGLVGWPHGFWTSALSLTLWAVRRLWPVICNRLHMLMSSLCLFLGLLNMHVCPKYWPVAETTSLKWGQEAWGSPRVWTVCLPPDWGHLWRHAYWPTYAGGCFRTELFTSVSPGILSSSGQG